MSCSKPLPPFTYDMLCYLNRDQLERFSIICRPLKKIIDRYFHCRTASFLHIRGGSYALDGKTCSINIPFHGYSYYSFAEMRPYLGPTVRIKTTYIHVAEGSTFNPEHIEQMESIAHLWRDGLINFRRANNLDNQIVAENFQLILNSPTILQCQELRMINAHFSFKDYKVLYSVNCIEMFYYDEKEIDTNSWLQFLEQPGVKPVVALHYEDIENLLDRLSKPSTPPPNHTPPSTHHSNHHHNATQQQTPASQTTGDTAQPSSGQNQQSNDPKKEAKRSQYDDPTSDEKWQKMGIKEQLDYLTKQGFK